MKIRNSFVSNSSSSSFVAIGTDISNISGTYEEILMKALEITMDDIKARDVDITDEDAIREELNECLDESDYQCRDNTLMYTNIGDGRPFNEVIEDVNNFMRLFGVPMEKVKLFHWEEYR